MTNQEQPRDADDGASRTVESDGMQRNLPQAAADPQRHAQEGQGEVAPNVRVRWQPASEDFCFRLEVLSSHS